jgi:hypothetical protein
VAPGKPDKRSGELAAAELAAAADAAGEADGSANPQQPASLRKIQRPCCNDDHSLELRLFHRESEPKKGVKNANSRYYGS